MPTTTTLGRVAPGGMGGFLNPPGHPEQLAHVETELRRRRENRDTYSLSAAADPSNGLDASTRAAAQRVLDAWTPLPLDDARVHDWVLQVLGYFKNCYRGLGPEPACWHAANLVIVDPSVTYHPVVDAHAGVHLIRTYYPEYMPSPEDFAEASWGRKPLPYGPSLMGQRCDPVGNLLWVHESRTQDHDGSRARTATDLLPHGDGDWWPVYAGFDLREHVARRAVWNAWAGQWDLIEFAGRCVLCRRRTYRVRNGETDPRGVVGDAASCPIDLREHLAGAQVATSIAACWDCQNDAERYHALIAAALARSGDDGVTDLGDWHL